MSKVALLLAALVAGAFAQGFDDPHLVDGRETIVHLFEWPWNSIAKECETFLGPYDYAAVQISPPMEHVVFEKNGNVPWYVRYQPVSYDLSSRSGDRQQLEDMIRRCNAVGVRIIVDVVINHMTYGTLHGVGSGGSTFDGRSLDYPAAGFGARDFHNECHIDFRDCGSIQYCRLENLVDLDTEANHVRDRIAAYMNSLIDMGVAGFRVDAAKHMLPQSVGAIYGRLNRLRSDVFGAGKQPFIVNEVIDYGPGDQPVGCRAVDYLNVGGRVTNFIYGNKVSDAVNRKDNFKYFVKFGEGYGMPSRSKVLNFIDNHDTQRDNCNDFGCPGHNHVLTYKDSYSYTMGVTFMLAHDYGLQRVMSGYAFNTRPQGPPSHGPYETRAPEFESARGLCRRSSGWVCEHRYPEIKNMAKFRRATHGEGIVYEATDEHRIAFRRGNKGFFMVNNDPSRRWEGTFYTGLPAGRYCDVIDGDIADNRSTCTDYDLKPNAGFVQVGADGRARLSVPPGKTLAISLASKLE